MSDTIDWSKRLQVMTADGWRDVDGVMLKPDGKPLMVGLGWRVRFCIGCDTGLASASNFRNKPETREPLECWVVMREPTGELFRAFSTENGALDNAERIAGYDQRDAGYYRVIHMREVQDEPQSGAGTSANCTGEE